MKKVQQNIGLLDSYLRIATGLMMLRCCNSAKKCHPVIGLLGSMKIAEGITRFCPCLYLLNKDTKNF